MTINVTVLNTGCAADMALRIVPIDANGERVDIEARIVKHHEFAQYITLWHGRSMLLEEVKLT